MSTFKEILEQSSPPMLVAPVYEYYAYKKGKAINCKNLSTATEISKNYEKVCVNEDEVKASYKAQSKFYAEMEERFYNDVRCSMVKSFPIVFGGNEEIAEEIFSKLKAEANKDVDQIDESVDKIEDLAILVEQIIRAREL